VRRAEQGDKFYSFGEKSKRKIRKLQSAVRKGKKYISKLIKGDKQKTIYGNSSFKISPVRIKSK